MEEESSSEELGMTSKTASSVASYKSDVGFFRDGKRRVDFILVYEKNEDESKSAATTTREGHRESFLRVLYETGVDLEEDTKSISKSKTLCFVKIYARWAILCKFAEYLNLRAPIAVNNSEDEQNCIGNLLDKWFGENVPNKPVLYFTCAFRMDKIKSFVGSENPQSFFSTTQRMRVVAEILRTVIYGAKERFEVGIDRLIAENTFSAAFPPHDGTYKISEVDFADPKTWNKRQILYFYWARYRKMFKYQPIEHIRQYFGEQIAIYFAWLGFYTTWLVPASIVGIITFLIGLESLSSPIIAEVCNQDSDIVMCPVCDEKSGCDFYKLNETCVYVNISYAFDHTFTVIYAIFVATWAVTFIEFWKRESTRLAHRWNCLNFESEEQVPRPEFVAKAKETEVNPVTGMLQPAFPRNTRRTRIAIGIVLLLFMISLVIICMLSVIIYKALVNQPLEQAKVQKMVVRLITNITGAILNLIAILLLGKVYTWLAFVLTSWEMHRTQTAFEDSFVVKVFLFQFVNFYSSIVYIAFFKGNFTGYPGNYNKIFGLRLDECMAGGCLVEVTIQMAIIMIGKQVINNVCEVSFPLLKNLWRRVKFKKYETVWEQDFQLSEHPGLFEEYLEMVIQFGFVTIFVAAFPLAPIFALINNLFEIRIDASKFLCMTRRAVPMRAESIGIWLTILQFLSHFAVIVNAFIIAFTSDFVPRQVYRYHHNWEMKGFVNYSLSYSPEGAHRRECRYRAMRDRNGKLTNEFWIVLACRLAFVVVFEHLVFGTFYILKVSIPDIPTDVSIKIKREHYLGKKALQDLDSTELFKRTAPEPKDSPKSEKTR